MENVVKYGLFTTLFSSYNPCMVPYIVTSK